LETKKKVPEVVIRRLPRYYRYLSELDKNGKTRISSTVSSEKMGVTASQIRQDFNYFGGFGQQGYGYSVKQLYTSIGKAMGVADGIKAIVICENNSSIFDRSVFESRGVELLAIFTNSSDTTTSHDTHKILDLEELIPYCNNAAPDLAVILPLKRDVQKIAESLLSCNIKGIWNFSSTEIRGDGISIKNTPLSDMLMVLCCEIHNQSNTEKED